MTLKYKAKRTLARFLKHTAGSIAMTWAVFGVGMIMTVGSTYDLNQVSKAKKIAQTAADTMALAASISVDTNNRARFNDGQSYPYNLLGGAGKDFTNSIVGSVQYDIDDDGDGVHNLIARATIAGSYQTAFISIMGVRSIEFSATSDVAYAQNATSPASVFLVLDNSGSMGGSIRGLKTTVKSLMDALGKAIDNVDPGDPKIIRTAMWPYNHAITRARILPHWGVISDRSINRMVTSSSTNSYPPMLAAWTQLQSEDAIHHRENGSNPPLKFVIFMTDGDNDKCYTVVTPGYWYWFFFWYPEVIDTKCDDISPYNQPTIDICNKMTNAGVQVYTIGYDLPRSSPAVTMLKSCASTPDYFKLAKDTNALAKAIEAIGKKVLKETIRIKS